MNSVQNGEREYIHESSYYSNIEFREEQTKLRNEVEEKRIVSGGHITWVLS